MMNFYFPVLHRAINLEASDIIPEPEEYFDGSYLPFAVKGVTEQLNDPMAPESVTFALKMTSAENAVTLILRYEDEEEMALHGTCSSQTFKELCRRFFENF